MFNDDEYVALLIRPLRESTTLNTLHECTDDSDFFNWVGASNYDLGFAPTRIMSEYFTIPYDKWWNYVPYRRFEYQTDKHKWWFSIFDEYDLFSIDFYYPINVKAGEEIEIWVDRPTTKIKWIQGQPGLTIACLLPHIYLFAIDIAMVKIGITPEKKREAVVKYCHNRMLDYTKPIRDRNAIINF